MSKDLRRSLLDRLPKKVRERSTLAELDREYTLNEIAIITRAAPARILGLSNKGHLGDGADGDVTIYSPSDDRRAMFAVPRHVIKVGEVIVENGELRNEPSGSTLHVSPEFNSDVVPVIEDWFDQHSSVKFEDFPVTA
jgi:formylmethanofuran dehydrogenase subunit A